MGVVPSTNQINETCLALGLQIPIVNIVVTVRRLFCERQRLQSAGRVWAFVVAGRLLHVSLDHGISF